MLKATISFLLALLLLTGCSRAEKPISQVSTYTWGVAAVNGVDSKFVCKKIDIAIYRPRAMQPDVQSVVVEDSHCANLAKPIVTNQTPSS